MSFLALSIYHVSKRNNRAGIVFEIMFQKKLFSKNSIVEIQPIILKNSWLEFGEKALQMAIVPFSAFEASNAKRMSIAVCLSSNLIHKKIV